MESKILSVCLFLTLLFLSFSSNAAGQEPVYDIDGEALIPGQKYYILPVFRGRGGGLTMRPHDDYVLCPPYVAQEELEVDSGLPVIFHPVNLSDTTVTLSTDMNIKFSAITICIISNTWQLGDAEGANNIRYVNAGGVIGNPGLETVNNWFKIEKGENSSTDYKLVFCPSVCETCRVTCGDLGVFIEDDKFFLGLNGDVSFPVRFRKVDSDQSQ